MSRRRGETRREKIRPSLLNEECIGGFEIVLVFGVVVFLFSLYGWHVLCARVCALVPGYGQQYVRIR